MLHKEQITDWCTMSRKHKLEGTDVADGTDPQAKKVKKEKSEKSDKSDKKAEKEAKAKKAEEDKERDEIKKQNKIMYKHRDDLEQLSKAELQLLLEHNGQQPPTGPSKVSIPRISGILSRLEIAPAQESGSVSQDASYLKNPMHAENPFRCEDLVGTRFPRTAKNLVPFHTVRYPKNPFHPKHHIEHPGEPWNLGLLSSYMESRKKTLIKESFQNRKFRSCKAVEHLENP